MNPSSPVYKNLDNLSLLKIIGNAGDYQPEAIEAAKEELAARQLNNDELAALQEEIAAEKREQQLKSDKVNALKDKTKDALYAVTDTLNPIQSEKPSLPKAILWLSILMILLFLYQTYTQFGLLKYMLVNSTSQWDPSMAMYFLRPLLIMPAGAILFALQKKSGWVLLSGYINYLGLNTMILFYFAYRHPPIADSKIALSLPAAPVNSLISWAIFIFGCLYFIYKRDVRAVYTVTKQNIAVAIILGIALCISAIL